MKKEYKKMTPEQIAGLLHMRKRNYILANKRLYSRKLKHKGGFFMPK